MAVEHMVWIKFKDGVNESRKAEHLDGLRALQGKIPGVIDVKVGENFTDRAKGFTHGLLVTLTDRAALEAYGPHPEHAAVAGPLKEDAELMAMDIEV